MRRCFGFKCLTDSFDALASVVEPNRGGRMFNIAFGMVLAVALLWFILSGLIFLFIVPAGGLY
jgi:hypothetical protein